MATRMAWLLQVDASRISQSAAETLRAALIWLARM